MINPKEIPECKYCNSHNIVKYGTHEGIQRYWCKDCKRKFADNKALPEMKTPIRHISSALSCYYGGMALDGIQRHLQQQFGIYYSEMGIYNWIRRFSKEAINRVKDFQPIVGDTWIADETVLKVGGKNIWFWDIIDVKSRYLLASRLSDTRTTKDAALLMKEASRKAGKIPKTIITDRLASYQDGVRKTFRNWGNERKVKHTSIVNKRHIVNNNAVENLHTHQKEFQKVRRGIKEVQTYSDGFRTYHNFIRKMVKDKQTPADRCGIGVDGNRWNTMLLESLKNN